MSATVVELQKWLTPDSRLARFEQSRFGTMPDRKDREDLRPYLIFRAREMMRKAAKLKAWKAFKRYRMELSIVRLEFWLNDKPGVCNDWKFEADDWRRERWQKNCERLLLYRIRNNPNETAH